MDMIRTDSKESLGRYTYTIRIDIAKVAATASNTTLAILTDLALRVEPEDDDGYAVTLQTLLVCDSPNWIIRWTYHIVASAAVVSI